MTARRLTGAAVLIGVALLARESARNRRIRRFQRERDVCLERLRVSRRTDGRVTIA